MDSFTVSPTSSASAVCDPIVLRESQTTRLVFQPVLVQNVHDATAPVNGTFVFQRRSPLQDWIDHKELDLSQLRAEQWVRLRLKAGEVKTLFEGLHTLYGLYSQDGIPGQTTRYLRTQASIAAVRDADENDLSRALSALGEDGLYIAVRLLRWITRVPNTNDVIDRLEDLGSDVLQKLNTLVGIGQLKDLLAEWEANSENPLEEYWQELLSKHTFVLSQAFAYPAIVLRGKAYVGGKSIANKGGNIVDFLMSNKLTGNTALVELKTPTTRLVGRSYREGIHNVSEDLTGAVMQVSDYKASLLHDYKTLVHESEVPFYVFDPPCLVIAGNLERAQLGRAQMKSFELFRHGLQYVQVITFDELFGKVRIMIELLEGAASQRKRKPVHLEVDDIPF
jgi:hypothetical protein